MSDVTHPVAGTTPPGDLSFRLLGPLEVRLDGDELPIATRRQRALLVLLLLNVGRVVPAERLIDQLWDGAPPPQAAVTLRSYVSNLRRALGAYDARKASGSSGTASVLVTRGQGYCLDVPPESLDSVRLRQLTEQGRAHLRDGRPQEALEVFASATSSWSGDPLAEVADHAAVQGTITELTETYLGAVEGHAEALLATGRHADAIAGLEAFVRDHPLREEPQALLMLALYRAGRSPDALEVYRRFRTLLGDELGIDPSPRLDLLHQRVLGRDPALAAPAVGAGPRAADAGASLDAVAPATAPPPRPAGAPARTDSPSTASPPRAVVGRHRELDALRGHLEQLAAGHAGSLVLLAGEPGIGKTTMLEALERDAREHGVRVVTGRAPAASGAPAFWTWTQVVDTIAGTLDDETLRRITTGAARPVAQLSASIAERTGQATTLTGDSPQLMRFLLYEAISTFIDRAVVGEPLLITLDDIHWADVPSLELLSYLTPTLPSRRLMLVAAYRDLPAERSDALEATLATVSREDGVAELTLAGLTPEDVALLLDDLAGPERDGSPHDPSSRDAFVAMLHQRTGGNPFFLRQLARLVLEAPGTGTRTSTGAGTGTGAVPPGVTHVIARRLAALPPQVEEFLAAAAVLGREFDLAAVAGVAGVDLPAALDAFDEAARHGLVETAGVDARPRFVHALVQEVVLERLPTGRAARLHARAAAHLQTLPGSGADELAEHLWAARDLVAADGVPAHLAAAHAAAAVFGYERAETHLRRALHLVRTASPPDPVAELPILLALFRLIATERGWGAEEARALVDRATELAGPAGCTDDNVRLWWSMFFFLLDRFDQEAYTELARTLLASLDQTSGNPAEPGRPGAGDATWAAVHLMNIFAALSADDRASARSHLRTAREHVEAAPNRELATFDEHLHVMLLVIEGAWASLIGEEQAYQEAVQGAVALADADGRPFPRAVARTLGAACAPYVGGDPTYVLDLAEQALELDRRFGFTWLEMVADSIRSWAQVRTGAPAEDAASLLAERLEQVGAQGHLGTDSVLLLLLADVHAVEGRTEQARECLHRVREVPGPYLGLVVDLVDRRLRGLATA